MNSSANASAERRPGGGAAELRALMPAAGAVLGALGLAGNAAAAGVLICNARRSKLSLINALILNLALADALLLLALPVKAASSHGGWSLGPVPCRTGEWILQTGLNSRSFTVALMGRACVRFSSGPSRAVCVRLRTVLLALVLLWAVAGSVALPQLLFSGLRQAGSGSVCTVVVPARWSPFMWVYVRAYPLLAFCGPLALALAGFCQTYSHRKHSKTQNLRTQIRSRKLALMLLGLGLAAALAVPHWVCWVWSQHSVLSDGPEPPALLGLGAQLLLFCTALADPLIVLALSEELRDGYIGLWRRLTLRKHPPKPKPGPHTPTALRSPTPRPEASAHGPETQEDRQNQRDRENQREQDRQIQEQQQDQQKESQSRDGPVLPDVEQFWQERESGSQDQENDPVPWEHQESRAGPAPD